MTVICPPSIVYTQGAPYWSTHTSYVGATAAEAQFRFPKTISSLPKCSLITDYELVEMNPSNAVSKAEWFNVDDQRSLVFSTNQEATITFKI